VPATRTLSLRLVKHGIIGNCGSDASRRCGEGSESAADRVPLGGTAATPRALSGPGDAERVRLTMPATQRLRHAIMFWERLQARDRFEISMTTSAFTAVIKIRDANPYIFVSAVRAHAIKPGWRRPTPLLLAPQIAGRARPESPRSAPCAFRRNGPFHGAARGRTDRRRLKKRRCAPG